MVDVFTALDVAGIGCADTTQAPPAAIDQVRAEVPVLAGLTGAGSCLYPPSGRAELPTDSLSVATFTAERGRLAFSLPSFDTTCDDLQLSQLSYVYGSDWTLWGTQGSGRDVMTPIAAATGGAVGAANCNRIDFALRALCPSLVTDFSRCDPSPAEEDFFRAALGETTTAANAPTTRQDLLEYFQTGVFTADLATPGAEERFEYADPILGFAVRYPASWAAADFIGSSEAGAGFSALVDITAVGFDTDLDLFDFRNAGDGQVADCISDRQILSGEAHPTTPRWFPRIAGSVAGQTHDAFVVAYTGSGDVPAECAASRDAAAYPLPLPHADRAAGTEELLWLIAFVTDGDIETATDHGYVITYVAYQGEFLNHLAEVGVIFESLIFTGDPAGVTNS
jgi:hypothetical protein